MRPTALRIVPWSVSMLNARLSALRTSAGISSVTWPTAVTSLVLRLSSTRSAESFMSWYVISTSPVRMTMSGEPGGDSWVRDFMLISEDGGAEAAVWE